MVDYQRDDACGRVRLGEQWQVQPSDELIQRLKDSFGDGNVRLNFGE
jgi:DNA polymerase-3 subunit alpha